MEAMLMAGAIGFVAGVATAVCFAALVAAGQADDEAEQVDERRAMRDRAAARRETQAHTKHNTDTQRT